MLCYKFKTINNNNNNKLIFIHRESLEKNYNEQKDRFERLLKNQKEYYESKLQELKKNTICGSDPETDIDRLLLEKDLLITVSFNSLFEFDFLIRH